MARELDNETLLEWARFVATKFVRNVEGWTYSRDLGDLKYIRYERDYSGRNHWTQRIRRAFDWGHLTGRDSLSRQLRMRGDDRNLRERFLEAYFWIVISLRKEKNLPDGLMNGNSTFWEEDGEYEDFIEAEPDNPHAVEIITEMRRMALKSFPGQEEEEE